MVKVRIAKPTLTFNKNTEHLKTTNNMSATYAPSRPSNFEDNSYRSNYG